MGRQTYAFVEIPQTQAKRQENLGHMPATQPQVVKLW